MTGVRVICRTASAAHPLRDRATWTAAIRQLWDGAGFREERYAAIALSGDRRYAGFQDLAAMDLYQKFVVEGAWWDHVDEVAIRRIGPLLRAEPGPLRSIMLEWSTDRDLWRRRASIICQVGAKTATDVALLVDVLAVNHADREFFIRKAIGWALRDYARTDPGWVRGYLAAHRDELSGLSRREAAKHL